MSTPLRIFLADDHNVVREGLRLLIDARPDMQVIGEAADGEATWEKVRELQPDILVLDISMPKLNGIQVVERMSVRCAKVKIVVLSAYEDEAYLRQLMALGAQGYILKSSAAEELTRAILLVADGGTYIDPAIAGKIVSSFSRSTRIARPDGVLSDREEEVLRHIAWGRTNKEIAEQLHLSVKTIESHKARIMQKLDFQSRVDFVRYALRRGWLTE